MRRAANFKGKNKDVKQETLKTRRRDPFLEREAQRYELPLPSREFILQTLEDEGRPVDFDQLTALMDITPRSAKCSSAASAPWSAKAR